MSHVVFALFEDSAVADKACTELSRRGEGEPGLDARVHEKHLDTNQLPEGATFFGRNLVWNTVGGSVFFAVSGIIIGIYEVVPGLSAAMGALLGVISGAVIGVYTAMQAGTRVAKEPIQALAPRLPQGDVLLTVEVDGRARAESIVEDLEERGATESGIC